MKKVAYLITRNGTRELIEGCLLTSIAAGVHGAKVLVMHFAEDGVYHLVDGTTTAKKIKIAMDKYKVKIIACECSVKNRGIENKLIKGVTIGHFNTFYKAAEKADHVVAI